MEITSLPFAVLALVSVLIFYLINPKYRIVYLAIISCCYIACYSYLLVFYILIYSLINYLVGRIITITRFKKAFFRTGIIINLSQLVLLKYATFAIDPIFRIFNSDFHISKLSEIIVPLGISYFTLQGIGYLINIKMGWEKPEKNYIHFLLYIVFFPKFLSGPIERSNHFLPQLEVNKLFNEQAVTEGLRIALFGFFKKIVIANQLGFFVNSVYSDLGSFGGINLWLVILIQPLYLYFDFSGYTDIAIGFAKMFGIELLPNFNKPFMSQNMTGFWKRFHISLSSWFNDYIFKQVCYRFRKWIRSATLIGVFITFTLFGIWHGAGWNYMVLGFLQALAINYEFFTKKARTAVFSRMPDLMRIWSGRIFTYIFYGLSLTFFFSPDINTAFNFISKLNNLDFNLYFGVPSRMAFILALVCIIVFLAIEVLVTDVSPAYKRIEEFWGNSKPLRLTVYYIVVFLIVFQINGVVSFIYQMF
jgi:alginate O-acetyltransferase complex protein AlgI